VSNVIYTVILPFTGRAAKALSVKGGACLVLALMIFAPVPSLGQQAYLVPCRDQLHMWQEDLSLKDKVKDWYCPDPTARTMPIPRPAGQSSAGGGIPMGLPTTEGQAMVTVMGWLFQGIMSSGSSADEQRQQALLQQKQAEEKWKAEMLEKERAVQASEARALWESQDAARSRELVSLFGPPTEQTGGMSSLLQKQAALQLRAAAAPGSAGSDENLRHHAGEGFDEAGKSLAAVPVVPEPEGPLTLEVVMTKIKETRAWANKLDREFEETTKKQEKAQQALEQARRELATKQAEPGPKAPQDDAALLAALEAEEQNIETLSREVEENSAQLKMLEDQRSKAAQELEMWNGKREAAQ